MRIIEKNVDKGIFICLNVNCRHELNEKNSNSLNSKSLPEKLVKLIINKIDTYIIKIKYNNFKANDYSVDEVFLLRYRKFVVP